MTDDWDTAYARQTDSLRDQLALLRSLPNNKRRQYRPLEYVCAGCQGTILEVWATQPRVVLGTGTALPEGKYPTQEQRDAFLSSLGRKPRVADWQEFHQRYVDWGRPDEIRPDPDGAKFHAIPDDLPGRRNTRMHYVCKCHQWDLSEAMLADDLRTKKKRRSLTPPRSDDGTPERTQA